jgi:hypothetical protein
VVAGLERRGGDVRPPAGIFTAFLVVDGFLHAEDVVGSCPCEQGQPNSFIHCGALSQLCPAQSIHCRVRSRCLRTGRRPFLLRSRERDRQTPRHQHRSQDQDAGNVALMILRNGPSATNLRQQLGQPPRVTHTIIAVTVVHQHVHLVRLFGEATDRREPAVQLFFRVEIAEPFGGADVRALSPISSMLLSHASAAAEAAPREARSPGR